MRPIRTLRTCAPVLWLLVSLIGCQPASTGNDNSNTNGGGNTGNTSADTVQGTWTAAAGLKIEKDGASLSAGANAGPSNTTLTLRRLTDDELRAGNFPANQGFTSGVELGPAGTTFAQNVTVTVPVSNPVADTLPVLVFDESTHTWGGAALADGTPITAAVAADKTSASFNVTHFSKYQPWNPPPPPGTVAIGAGEIIAGSGSFEGQPFNTLPNPHAADASLTYSPFGHLFSLAIIQLDATNPATGDFFTLSAGLHASQTSDNNGTKVGLVTAAGDLGGPSIYNDGGLNKPVNGIMFLRKTATQWIVDAYCAFENGIVFGQATGNLN